MSKIYYYLYHFSIVYLVLELILISVLIFEWSTNFQTPFFSFFYFQIFLYSYNTVHLRINCDKSCISADESARPCGNDWVDVHRLLGERLRVERGLVWEPAPRRAIQESSPVHGAAAGGKRPPGAEPRVRGAHLNGRSWTAPIARTFRSELVAWSEARSPSRVFYEQSDWYVTLRQVHRFQFISY